MTASSWLEFAAGLILSPILSALWVNVETAVRRARPRLLPLLLRSKTGSWAGDVLDLWKWNGPVQVGVALSQREFAFAAGFGVSTAIAFLIGWWRKRRDRVKSALGAKSRALRDALAARMPKPRAALIPQRAYR